MHPDDKKKIRLLSRPILFWWPTGVMFVIVGLLLYSIPFAAIRRQSLILAVPLPAPTASYVTLDPDTAMQRFRRSLATWMTGQAGTLNAPGLDLTALDFDNGLDAPAFLDQSAFFPGDWQPPDAAALPVALADISLPSATPAKIIPLKPKDGIFIEASPALTAAGFTFPSDELKAMTERSGTCCFFVETDAEGNVAHVLLRSTPSPLTPPVERILSKGRANGAATGSVDIRWSFSK